MTTPLPATTDGMGGSPPAAPSTLEEMLLAAAALRVHAEIQKQVDAVNKRFARIEQIKCFAILDEDLTQAAGELTPTLKVKRAAVYDRYSSLFGALYEVRSRS